MTDAMPVLKPIGWAASAKRDRRWGGQVVLHAFCVGTFRHAADRPGSQYRQG
jgi:hypothetical protein